MICCSTRSVILNAMATQYTCLFNSTYLAHWLVQWSRHCLQMHILVHALWLSGYINGVQTILVMLTIVGLSLDRPCVHESLSGPYFVLSIWISIPSPILDFLKNYIYKILMYYGYVHSFLFNLPGMWGYFYPTAYPYMYIVSLLRFLKYLKFIFIF